MPSSVNEQNEWIVIPSVKEPSQIMSEIREESRQVDAPKNIWKTLEEKKKRGEFSGDIETLDVKEYSLNKGKHYYVVEDAKSRSIKCISCPVSHGTYLEARYLSRYRIDDGVLYFDDIAMNERADVTRNR